MGGPVELRSKRSGRIGALALALAPLVLAGAALADLGPGAWPLAAVLGLMAVFPAWLAWRLPGTPWVLDVDGIDSRRWLSRPVSWSAVSGQRFATRQYAAGTAFTTMPFVVVQAPGAVHRRYRRKAVDELWIPLAPLKIDADALLELIERRGAPERRGPEPPTAVTARDELATALRSLELDAAGRFAAACAVRLRPVIQAFGSEPARRAYDAAVECLWRAEHAEVERALGKLGSAPEADEDDSHRSSYEAMLTLSVAAYGLDLLRASPRAESAIWVAGAAADIAASLDAYLGGASALEEAELADQLAQARRLAEPALDVEDLRREAEAAAARVADVLPAVARRQGWHLNEPSRP